MFSKIKKIKWSEKKCDKDKFSFVTLKTDFLTLAQEDLFISSINRDKTKILIASDDKKHL